LNTRTGGTESHKRALRIQRSLENEEFAGFDDTEDIKDDDTLRIVPTPVAIIHTPVSEVKISRDADGNATIVGRNAKSNPLNDLLNDVASDEENDPIMWGSLGHVGSTAGPDRGVVSQLEALAESGERKAPRKQSTREVEWIERLVNKHGDDYRAMSRDMKLNPMQQSEGDLKRRIKKWKIDNTTG
jgi:nucleolar protein 16